MLTAVLYFVQSHYTAIIIFIYLISFYVQRTCAQECIFFSFINWQTCKYVVKVSHFVKLKLCSDRKIGAFPIYIWNPIRIDCRNRGWKIRPCETWETLREEIPLQPRRKGGKNIKRTTDWLTKRWNYLRGGTCRRGEEEIKTRARNNPSSVREMNLCVLGCDEFSTALCHKRNTTTIISKKLVKHFSI